MDETGREYDRTCERQPMVLATVSDGTYNAVLRPDQMESFLRIHSDKLIVFHNAAFDFWVIDSVLSSAGRAVWRRRADNGLIDDTMLLDFLCRIADPAEQNTASVRNLGKLAELVGLEADKASPYRLTFHQLIGKEWDEVDPGFFEYAVADTYVTWHVYKYLRAKAVGLAGGLLEGAPTLVQKHGLLTSKMQTRAAIVLDCIGHNGMGIDRGKAEGLVSRLQVAIGQQVSELSRIDPAFFRYYKRAPRAGQAVVNKKTNVPCLNYNVLRLHLADAAAAVGYPLHLLPKTPTGGSATRLEDWRRIAPDSEIVQHWGTMADTAKVLQFVLQVSNKDRTHPRYQTLVRTGRTSCQGPNIQQMPREAWFREMFVPAAGHKFVIVDYSAIELRTLAAVLLDLYGESRLADVLRAGVCPHIYTASIITGWDYEEIKVGVKAEKAAGEVGKYGKARQAAKAINFGVPGGLGVRTLCNYARTNYGVDMSEDQAKEFRTNLITEVYPELQNYLKYDVYATVAKNIGTTPALLRKAIGWDISAWDIETVLRHDGKVAAAQPLNKGIGPKMIESGKRARIWEAVDKLNQNPQLQAAIERWESGNRQLVGETSVTLTGRIRSGLDYGETRNTRFQGLAADGAKVALWHLFLSGFRVVGFIHDEVICECPEETAAKDKEAIETIMKSAMSGVLNCDVPVEVEGVVADSWVK